MTDDRTTDDHGTVREIAWREVFPWLILGRALRVAFSFRMLILSAVGLLAMTAGWRLIQDVFSASDDAWLAPRLEQQMPWPWQRTAGTTLEAFAPDDATEGYAGRVPLIGPWLAGGPVVDVWRELAVPFFDLFSGSLTLTGLAFVLLCCVWAALMWGFFGGALTRIAALFLARDEPLGIFGSLNFSRGKLGAYLVAPLLPVLGVLLASIPLWAMGLVARLDIGALLVGLFWGVAILGGVFLAILALGLLFGWPLLAPTISTEGSDSFDALSRSYAYVSQRPLHYLFYVLVASVLGLLGILLVEIFAGSVLYLSQLSMAWGAGTERMKELANPPDEGLLALGVSLMNFWQGVVVTVALAFRVSFFWAAATAIYLLLRRSVDATEMDEVYLDLDQEPYSLPPLETDPQGVPQASGNVALDEAE